VVHSQSSPCNGKKYTVKEVRDLRAVCEQVYLYGTSIYRGGFSRTFNETDKTVTVEQMVRTYILAGIVAKDIREEDEKKLRKREALKEKENE